MESDSTSPAQPDAPAAPSTGAGFPAVLLLDSAGLITAANTAARQLWRDAPLPGRHVASLFAFEIVSQDPDFLAAQWEALLAGAVDRELPLEAQPAAAADPLPVRLRLEKFPVAPASFLATLQPHVAQPPSSAGDWPAAFRLLGEKSLAGFFDLNFAANSVHFSPAWKKLLGYAAPELPDTLDTWRRLIHPDDSSAAPLHADKKSRPGAWPINVEFRMRHQRGHWAWAQCLAVETISASGQLERVAGLLLDISDRKDLEDTLVANDSRLRDLASGPLPTFELDFQNDTFWFSPAWENLLGHPRGSLPASPDSLSLPSEDAPDGPAAWLLSRAPGENTLLQPARLRARDGTLIPVLLGAHRSITRKHELLRAVGFACRLPSDAALPGTPSSTLAFAACDALAEGLLIADTTGKILFANTSAARLLRVTPAALHDRLLGDVFRLHHRDTLRPGNNPVERLLSATQPLPLISEDALAPAEGDAPPIPIVWTARELPGPDGRPQAIALVFRDPDEMTLTPEELVKANRLEALGLLAGGIAHDFNNLLTTILGAVSLAKDNRDYRALADAEKACDTARGLTRQLLAFAKGGAGAQTVCDARGLLDDALKIAAAASTADIALQVSDDTHPVQVDRPQILQVFQNLVVNALQAMPPAPHQPRLQLRADNTTLADNQVPALPAGDYVEFEVRDNGTGIKPEHVAKIFDPFFTTKKHGTGLGLATVLSLVRKHGGQIALDTQVGVGTAFTVYLPRAARPIEAPARRAASLRFGTGRVLFMDDDPQISELTGAMLESLGYKYDLASRGEEAITLYQRYLNIGRPYDVVIMDITVIGGMGADACFVELQKLDPEVRAIVASGYDNPDIERQYLDRGFCGYLAKPYRVTDLGKILKAVLS